MDLKIEELKTLVTKIDNTFNGKERQQLKERGNKVMVTLYSLYELYETLGVGRRKAIVGKVNRADIKKEFSAIAHRAG